MIGLGTQDDFAYAEDFLQATGVSTPTMLWDPSFATWQGFGARINSQMVLLSSDLERGTELFYGFGETEQQGVLDALPDLG